MHWRIDSLGLNGQSSRWWVSRRNGHLQGSTRQVCRHVRGHCPAEDLVSILHWVNGFTRKTITVMVIVEALVLTATGRRWQRLCGGVSVSYPPGVPSQGLREAGGRARQVSAALAHWHNLKRGGSHYVSP